MKSILPALVDYGSANLLPMHMPGHKRRSGFMQGLGKYDITEVDGFDDLHHPRGVLERAMAEAAGIYGSDATFFLVNGSTAGILTAIAAVTKPGDKILIARNCHKSVLNAVYLRELDPLYVYPEKETVFGVDGSVDPKAVAAALTKDGDIRAVVVTSPSYEGVVSDLRAIAEIVHGHHIPLIVDGAHGAHFHFGQDFPGDALGCGADLVVESLHKTLPSLTQTALLHVKSALVDLEEVKFQLQIFQSSSPSYLLIASITECLSIMTHEGECLMAAYSENLGALRKALGLLSRVTLLGQADAFFDYDPGKLVFGFEGYSGTEIAGLLRADFQIETEMAALSYVVAMTSVYDTKEGLCRFGAALAQLCRELPQRKAALPPLPRLFQGEKVLTPAEVRRNSRRRQPLKASAGAIAAETLYLYPPGTPLLVAGEKLSESVIERLTLYQSLGFFVHGVENGDINVV